MKLTEFFFKRNTFFWTCMVMITFAGIYSYIIMPKLEDPELSVKQAMVVTYYPGASAHEVELEVTSILEDELRTLSNISEIESVSSENMSSITVNIDFAVPVEGLEQRWDILRRKVESAVQRLPSGSYPPVVVDDVSDIYGMFYALSGDGYTLAEMEKYAGFIKRELLELKGVKRITLFGTRAENVNITLPKEMIARNSIYPMQIMTTIDSRNQPVNAGHYYSDGQLLRNEVGGKIKSAGDVEGLIMQTPSGQQVKLGDIAGITREYANPQTNGFWVDGRPAMALCVSMEPGVVVTDVGKRVEARMTELEQRLPAGFEYEKIYFQPDRVSDAIGSFNWNLVISVLIVVLVLILTMGIRGGLIIGVGLLLTVLMTFPILVMTGGTLQRISLGAFIVAMGMLVDNAVVVLDGILVDRGNGLPPKIALFQTAKNTAWPLLGATLIAIITFLPVGLSNDTAGEYARDLFFVLAISLLVSWLLAMTQIPVFVKLFLPSRVNGGKKPKKIKNQLDTPIHRVIRRSLYFFMKRKLSTYLVSFGCLAVAFVGFFSVKSIFFPDFDYNQLYVEYTLPRQTHPDRVKHDLLEISKKLSAYGEINKVAASQAQTPARYCLVRSINAVGNNYGELIVDFDDYRDAYRLLPEIQTRLREEYPDAYVRVRKYNFAVSTSHTVEAMFSGPDPQVLRELAEKGKEIMRGCAVVDAYSVTDNWQPKGKSIYRDYAEQSAKRAGIARGDIAHALMASSEGLPIGLIYENDKSLTINLKVTNSDGSRITDQNDIPVWSMIPHVSLEEVSMGGVLQGTAILDDITDNMFRTTPLSQVTDNRQMEWEETIVARYGGKRAIKVQCDPIAGEAPGKVLSDVKDRFGQIDLPAGYSLQWLGEQKLQSSAFTNIFGFIPITLVLIILILVLLFNNMRKVLLVILCLPFAFIGITPALMISGTPFTFMGIIGAMGLMGMLIKNAIVLLDEITRLTKEGIDPYDAVINSTINRTRPVVMASATTILGMLPLLFDPMYSSLAVVVIAGLTAGTIITLILLPIFYSLFFNIQKPSITA
jgi:multidrug efflux pump subunit AcrB